MWKIPKTFIGWTNVKWVIKELVAMHSGNPSYFSKKRIESSAAFWLFYLAMSSWIYVQFYVRNVLGNSEFIADMIIVLLIAGYNVKKLQDEKVKE